MANALREPIGEDPLAFWRYRAGELHANLQSMTTKRDLAVADLGKAEHTVREQQVEIDRLKRQLSEARSHG